MALIAMSERDLQRIEIVSKAIELDSKHVEWKDVRASTVAGAALRGARHLEIRSETWLLSPTA
ncbi:hypothetical protein [Sinorhizobium meliloti]|jgi:hypothetical protein|uniref:hypothetical protein n=1 Tax=Rhizobium meliloti TaxID=382 RepID=UPI000D1E1BC6|nr:hypothetical protein [Sinorhizobium meliloti]RMI18162.1 hypothetical protein DA102_021395 [Sinorhizobium meliloti]RVH23180.1 hypothetical protein CN215_20245 [Sinorhizobium meliloti]RVO57538.1 hypothetical protein CN092_13060 [Sinorhizobium meliloti]WQP12005.1 hypothetical protein U8C30_10660 [Sinorhizobium meliloti]WQP25480.1 hypothetical protein U8C43_10635 [Sinorhizobium meliloti]